MLLLLPTRRVGFGKYDWLYEGAIAAMALSKEDAVGRARADLVKRLGVSESEIKEDSVEQADFPDLALGAPVEDEMSGQMIASGWRIRLRSGGESYEYRADRNHVRLYNYKGSNYRV
jgi:hypothetical protein